MSGVPKKFVRANPSLDDASDLKVRRAIAQRDKRVKKLQKSLAEVK